MLSLFLAGCQKPCPDPDVDSINALYFSFKLGGTDGFTQSEIDSTMIIRFIMVDTTIATADTLYYNGHFYNGTNNEVRISNTIPWNNDAPPVYPNFSYVLQNPQHTFSDTIANIKLKGEYTNNCGYNNEQKTFTFNGNPVDMSGSLNSYVITH